MSKMRRMFSGGALSRCAMVFAFGTVALLSGCGAHGASAPHPAILAAAPAAAQSATDASALAGTNAAPSAGAADDSTGLPTISIVPKSLNNPIFLDAKVAAESEGRKLGLNIEWIAPYTTDTEKQIRIVRWLIKRHVAGILISCNDPAALAPVINEGIAAGVKIATFDSDSPASKRLFYVGTDNAALGSAAAKTLLGILAERKGSAGTGAGGGTERPLKAVILTGKKEAYNLNQRIDAFKRTLSSKLRVTYLPTLYCNDSISQAIDLTGQITETDPDLNIIFFTGGWLFYAPLESMRNYANWIHAGGVAVTIDSTYPVLEAEQRKLVQGVCGQDFAEMGKLGVELLDRSIHGAQVPKIVYTSIRTVTPKQVSSYLDSSTNYEIQ